MSAKNNKNFTTISDVANYAKVGKTSVSRYLNGEKEKLTDALQNKIAQAIAHLDYRPNHSARMLRAGQSKLIGLLLADVTNPYSIDVLQGIEHICQQEGYMLMVCNTDNQETLQDRYLDLLEAHRVDGIIVNTAGMAQNHIHKLQRLSCPVVLVDRGDTRLGFDTVGLDNHAAAQEACEHLVKRQHNAIMVISEPTHVAPRQARVSAIQSFSQRHQLICQVHEIDKAAPDAVKQAIEDFVVTYPKHKKALFTTNGVAMMATAKALKALKMSTSKDISLIGIDDPEWAQLYENGITVMRQPTQQIGQAACERLLARIQNKNTPLEHRQLKAELILRHST